MIGNIGKSKFRKYLIFLLLIPFFELQTFDMLSNNGINAGLFNALLSAYSALRLLISLCVFIYVIRKDKSGISYVSIAVIAFVLMENIASAINGSIFINFTIGSVTYIGFVLMLQLAIKECKDTYIWACKSFFSILSVAGALQIIIMPHGFLNHANKAYAIYLLGAKNTSFFYYAVALYFIFYDDLRRFNKIRKRSFLFWALFVFAAIQCNSMNTLMMLLIMFALCIILNYGKILRKFMRPAIIILAVIAAAIVILLPEARVVLTPILDLIGRDTSFTGRDVLWVQAIELFKKHPLFGNGIKTEYLLETGVWQDNAHSQFLDLLSKHGLFALVIYMSMPVFALNGAVHRERKDIKAIALKGMICFVVLFHSVADHMAVYHYILLMVSVELLTIHDRKKNVSQTRMGTKGKKYERGSIEKAATYTAGNA